MKVGYARVSTTGQTLDAQQDALRAAGCEKVYSEQKSGKQADTREQLQEVLRFVRDGDALVVTKLDRLARSSLDLQNIAKVLREKRADLIVLEQAIDTTTPAGKLMFDMIGAFAEFERSLILERTQEGRLKAQAAGKHMGRRATLTEAQQAALRAEWAEWAGSASELAEKHGISRATLYRVVSDGVAANAVE